MHALPAARVRILYCQGDVPCRAGALVVSANHYFICISVDYFNLKVFVTALINSSNTTGSFTQMVYDLFFD